MRTDKQTSRIAGIQFQRPNSQTGKLPITRVNPNPGLSSVGRPKYSTNFFKRVPNVNLVWVPGINNNCREFAIGEISASSQPIPAIVVGAIKRLFGPYIDPLIVERVLFDNRNGSFRWNV